MNRVVRFARWLPILAVVPLAGACDDFLTARGRVVDCATNEPLVGATVSGFDDMGLSKGQTVGSVMTASDGTFELDTAVNAGDWVTLRISKPGYAVLDHQVRGEPLSALALCLDAAPAR